MKKNLWKALLVNALVVIGFVGEIHATETLLPFGQLTKEAWEGKYFYALNDSAGPAENWYAVDFDESTWNTISGPISTSSSNCSYYNTLWAANYSSYWVRRHFTLDELNSTDVYCMYFLHDDGCEAYLNGHLVYNYGSVMNSYKRVALTAEMMTYLREGDNVLAVKVSDTGGGQAFADFGLYSSPVEDFSSASSEVKLTVENDEVYPWVQDVENQCWTNSNIGTKYSTSTISFSYQSDYQTELMFDWACYSNYHSLNLYVDGELKSTTTNSSYTTPRYYLQPGEHVITLSDTIGNSTSVSNWSRVKNVCVREILPLEDSLLTAKSEQITFQNDENYPWTWEGGYAQSSNYGYNKTISEFSTTFTVEEPSKFSFDVCVEGSYYDNHFGWDVNGDRHYSVSPTNWNDVAYTTGWVKKNVLLEPGKYTITFLDSVSNSDVRNKTFIRNVELSSAWLEIDLASAGTLGVEVLYQVDVLTDVELLKVKGTLNSEDWAVIKQMTNLVGLDLSEARFDAMPEYAFDGLTYLSGAFLPEGMTSIGQYAFRGTQIWKIDIPSTVTSIGQYAFVNTRLEEITFLDNSQLTTIGSHAFYGCASLREFIMPNTVTELGTYAFYGCSVLKKIHFSDGLTSIPEYTCYECYRLSDVHWPKGLVSIGYQAFRDVDDLYSLEFPETLTSIGSYCFWSNNSLTHVKLPAKLTSLGDEAFCYCQSLKYIEFPSYVAKYYRTLYDVDNIDTIVCHAPTPPAVSYDVLYSGRAKGEVTLVVPSFAVVNYKLDPYWYQFGNIVGSEEEEAYWKVAGELALTNNRRMGGKPDIDLYYNGSMMVGGDAAFEAGTMNFFVNESQPCRLLNNCPTVAVDSINTCYSVSANTWYFFTPLYDVEVSKVKMSNDASYVIRYYNGAVRASSGTGSSWQDVPQDSVLLAGQGYIFRCNKACVVNMPATPAVHSQVFDFAEKNIALVAHETEVEANKNWNYVGNPYPCYYDIWYMDFTAPITVWTGSTYAAYSITDDDYVLRPMQSFFVQKPDEEESIVFKPEGRQVTKTVAHASYAARSNASRFVFNIEIGTDSVCDRTRVVFNAAKSMNYELECDASKFMSMDATVPQIYSVDAEANRLAINERPMADGRVALGIYVGEVGYYTLSASRLDGTALLYDALTDTYTDLKESAYTFHADEAGFIEGRFALTLGVNGGATGIEAQHAGHTRVIAGNGIIRVEDANGAQVQLYSMEGKLLHSVVAADEAVELTVPAGVYVAVVNGVSYKAVVY